ncbi:SGNH/GDSL hydrolase family protein [Spirosoma fluviale]|uniref:GDSL-like Lipase/Acylhydrolase family protein n=1 Tax=Spirosoma fluviale TaxID=1597977 RepID=A0A286GCA3_9BACT|nr:SGNH/GDSL hydrolase family protein [Spirosoma fluviale]SOD93165.1 GDSL-like Lipase/Acylhydrolase family protein [Spirosoma fluviale]
MNKYFLILALVFLTSSFTHKEISWVAIGDSITYLNEHLDETGNRITKGYMTRVKEQLPYIQYTNQGHNGWTAGRIASSIETLGLVKADLYSVFLGTNDWWAGRPLGTLADYERNTGNATVYGSFRIIINKLRTLNPQAPIILITPMQRVDFVYLTNFKNNAYGSYKPKNGQLLESFANAIDSIGRYEHLPVVDLYHMRGLDAKKLVKYKRLKDPKTGVYTNYPYPKFIDVPFNPETDEYPYPMEAIDKTYDGLHPSDAGYSLISHKLVKIIKQYR